MGAEKGKKPERSVAHCMGRNVLSHSLCGRYFRCGRKKSHAMRSSGDAVNHRVKVQLAERDSFLAKEEVELIPIIVLRRQFRTVVEAVQLHLFLSLSLRYNMPRKHCIHLRGTD